MRTHALAPSILPLLEAPVEGFFWNLPEFGRRIQFDVLHGCETRLLEAHFRVGNSQRSLGVRPAEYGGCVMTGMLLAVPYSENGPPGDAFHNHGGHQIECNGRTPEDSKRRLRWCYQQWQDRWSKCMGAQGSYFEGD